jgi:pyridoxal phosphate enzyme (YggS family)
MSSQVTPAGASAVEGTGALASVVARMRAATPPGAAPARLLAVSKTKPAAAIRALAVAGQRAFGENYVQEAIGKMPALADLSIAWHLIGPLQSNKARDVARHFDWIESVDRLKLVPLLAEARPADLAPLNVLVQVNIDDEASKAGAPPDAIDALADAIAASPRLRLRGLMAIPAPHADLALRRDAFRRMRALFDALRERHGDIDTLSMGMSDDFELAIAEGATQVRVGTLLFGARGNS